MSPKSMILLALLVPVIARAGSFVETFETSALEDETRTSADWNTDLQELRMGRFVPASLGVFDSPGVAEGVVVVGTTAFLADGGSGLRIVDMSDPASPVSLGSYDTPGYAYRVAVDGDYALVADGSPGVHVIDISDPAHPVLVSTYDSPSLAIDVAIEGDLAFVADYSGGLAIVDISNPSAPSLVSSITVGAQVYDCAYSGRRVFLAANTGGLAIVDVMDPAHPTLVGSYDTPGQATGVAVSGGLALLADGNTGLLAFDVSNPSAPTLLGTYDTNGVAKSVAVSEGRAYVADGSGGVVILDVTDPSDPVLASTFSTAADASSLFLAGERCFVAASQGGLEAVQVRTLLDPVVSVGQFVMQPSGIPSIQGHLIGLSGGADGFVLLDVSDPSLPVPVSTYPVPSNACRTAALHGDFAFASFSDGFRIFDITDPTDLVLVSYLDIDPFDTIEVRGHLVFLLNSAYCVVLDCSDPTDPQVLASDPEGGQAIGLAGNLLVVQDAHPSGQFSFYDVSNPAQRTLLGSVETYLTDPARIELVGNLAFFGEAAKLYVFDIEEPSHPVEILQIVNNNIRFSAFDVVGNLMFCGAPHGMTVLDFSDPTSPVVLTSGSGVTVPKSISVSGQYAYVTYQHLAMVSYRIFQDAVDGSANLGRSLPVDGADETIVRARLLTDETPGISWQLSADGGETFQPTSPNGSWERFPSPGTDLVWQSTHSWSPASDPIAYELSLDWLTEAASIDAVEDIPDDQGGWVRLHVSRSGYDFADESTLPVTGYQVYRRVDDLQLRERLDEAGALGTLAEFGEPGGLEAAGESGELENLGRLQESANAWERFPGIASFPPERVLTLGGRTYVRGPQDVGSVGDANRGAGELPPGDWEVVAWVAARQTDDYTVEAHTVADSTADGVHWSVFLTTAHTTTPSIWFACEPDSGYSIDDIAPGVPEGFHALPGMGGTALSWQSSADEDFAYFRVYRGEDSDFPLDPSHLVYETADLNWFDGSGAPLHHYKLTALDLAGNESEPAVPEETAALGEVEPIGGDSFAFPNPFASATEITFAAPEEDHVSLVVYDSSGRIVRRLLDERMSAGRHQVQWTGTDDSGRRLATGVYFYRLEVGTATRSARIHILR
ncbi:MAG: FlgD immunoglobulin-like domain containing protein [Candidatus Eisenbacteria bacterium]